MAEILIIEDEVKLRQELEVYLNNNGYLTKVIESFENTLEQMNQFDGDLILLDINLPNVNGQFLCKEYRKNSSKPIIIVTSRNNEMDELMAYLWDSDMFVDDNTLTVNINRLRKKLEDIGLNDVIHTRRGQGYIIL